MTRVECLYRVSTKGQVDHDDIPMQRIECRKFAEQQGWNIIKELCEKGVSGFKISADDRDAIQELREDAMNQRFDVLLVFMFDRLGRRDDETPFVVEWFAKQGIRIFSVKRVSRSLKAILIRSSITFVTGRARASRAKHPCASKPALTRCAARGAVHGRHAAIWLPRRGKGPPKQKGQAGKRLGDLP